MNYTELCKLLTEAVDKLGKRIYDVREARAVARVFLEDLYGFSAADMYGGREAEGCEEISERRTSTICGWKGSLRRQIPHGEERSADTPT